MKKFKFHNAVMTIDHSNNYGHYILTGLNTRIRTTDSQIYDYCTDDSQKGLEVRRRAYNFLKGNIY